MYRTDTYNICQQNQEVKDPKDGLFRVGLCKHGGGCEC